MFSQMIKSCQSCLMGLAIAGAGLSAATAAAPKPAPKAAPAPPAAVNKNPAKAAKEQAPPPPVVVEVKQAVSDSVPLTPGVNGEAAPEAVAPQATKPTGPNGEKIEMNFRESDQDILTRQAMEKLDVLVESLEFTNADLQNVIRIIGERLNINFIFDSGEISGKITLHLRNIRLRDALDSILSTRKMAIIADHSGIFRIVSQERVGRKLVETKTEVIQLNWVQAMDVAKTMKNFISSDSGKMEFNEESNSIIITDVPPQIEVIRNLISQIDIPERQVMIEARLTDVNIEALRNLKVDLSVSKLNENLQVAPAGGALPPVNTLGVVNNLLNGFSVRGGQGTIAFGQTVDIFGSEHNLQAVFTALEERNFVEILANPRVSTLNNTLAKISIIQKIPWEQASGMTGAGTQQPTIAFAEVGVEISVKPIITPNGFVRLDIQLKQTIFRGRIPANAPLGAPVVDERNATSNVIVPDGNTVVLGGLRQQRRQESISGVPWMHEIPLFGWLFKDKGYDQTKTELILMMTPTIISKKAPLTDTEKYWYDKIDNTWHLPDYFFDDVKSALDNKGDKKNNGKK